MTSHTPKQRGSGHAARSSSKPQIIIPNPKKSPMHKKPGTNDNNDDDRAFFSTRLCVRNLPGDTTEEQVRNWLLQVNTTQKSSTEAIQVQINDCRVLRKGKQSLAFVGVASPEQADFAIQHFHRTYYRTSRIEVERAYKSAKQLENQQGGSKTLTAKKDQESEARPVGASAREASTKTKALATAVRKPKFWANEAVDSIDDPVDAVRSDEESTSTSHSESEATADGGDDQSTDEGRNRDSPPKTNPSQSDLAFLQSIQTGADDLEQGPTKAELSSDSDDESSSDDGSEAVPLKPPAPTENLRLSPSLDADAKSPSVTQDIALSNRIFVRNLPFSATEEDLKALFLDCGFCSQVVDCHIPVTDQKRPKGFAFVTLSNPKEVAAAITKLDGCDFQGRILHLLMAHSKPEELDGQDAVYGRSYKDKKDLERRKQVDVKVSHGLSSFVRSDAVVDTLASRMGFQKGDVLSVKDGLSAGDAAVRVALGETAVIEENRKFLESRGIALDVDETKGKRSNTSLLVKNLPADTTKDELTKLFGTMAANSDTTTFGPTRLDLAPSRTLAVVEYSHRNDAKTAMRRLAYRRFKSVPLYIECAPLVSEEKRDENDGNDRKDIHEPQDVQDTSDDVMTGSTSTVHVKNLNFATTEERLRDFILEIAADVRAVRIPQKVVPVKRVGREHASEVRSLSMGYGFVEFESADSCRKVIKALQGAMLDGHSLELAPSAKNHVGSVATTRPVRQKPIAKLVVRNVPFQATRKDLVSLFGSFGHLKKLRLPKKFDGSHRGFAFVEYLTNKEADAAYKALSSTHLYGRHLVIEWATEDDEDIDRLREKTKRSVDTSGSQKAKKIRVSRN